MIVDHLRGSGFDVLWVAELPELRRQNDNSFHYQKARELGRYLVTHDADFWDDQKHPLKESPGVVILATQDSLLAKYLPVLLRKLVRDYNPTVEPLFLEGVKINLSAERIVIKMVDRDTQKVTTDSWAWQELF